MAGKARTCLSDRERIFVREYMVDLNASKAGIRAGYSPNSIGSSISRTMKRPAVKAAIAAAMEERERDLQIDGRAVLREIARLCFSNMMDYMQVTPDGGAEVDLTGLTRDRAAAITEITLAEGAGMRGRVPPGGSRVKLKLADKPRSLLMLGQHLGLFARGRDPEGARAHLRDGFGGLAHLRDGFGGQAGRVTVSDTELAQRMMTILMGADREAEEGGDANGEAGPGWRAIWNGDGADGGRDDS